MIYVQIKDGVVVNRAVFDGALPQDWPDAKSWAQDDAAQIGWTYDGKQFVPPPLSPDNSRPWAGMAALSREQKLATIGLTVADLKAMLSLI